MADVAHHHYLAARVADLTAEEQRLLGLLQRVREQQEEVKRTLEREISPPPAPAATAPVETWRRVVREMGVFTVSELAAELDCTPVTAKKHLNAMMANVPPLVAPAGRVLGKPVYQYVRPTEPGEKFEAQQRHRTDETPHLVAVDVPDRGTVAGVTKNPVSSGIQHKVLRAAVQDAERRGWALAKKGDGHFVLTKGRRRVPVASTPRNPDGAADIVRRMTRD